MPTYAYEKSGVAACRTAAAWAPGMVSRAAVRLMKLRRVNPTLSDAPSEILLEVYRSPGTRPALFMNAQHIRARRPNRQESGLLSSFPGQSFNTRVMPVALNTYEDVVY